MLTGSQCTFERRNENGCVHRFLEAESKSWLVRHNSHNSTREEDALEAALVLLQLISQMRL